MKDEAFFTFVLMAVAVILPMIPAFILFKFLPSTGDTSGPMQGLVVKFGGSFAGYLVVFASLLVMLPERSDHYHTWTIVGKVDFSRGPAELQPNVNDVFIRAVPPRLSVLNDGTFSWDVAVAEDSNGQLVFPFVQLDLPGYQGVTLPLGRDRAYGTQDAEIMYDEKTKQVRIVKPIILRSTKLTPTYQSVIQGGGK